MKKSGENKWSWSQLLTRIRKYINHEIWCVNLEEYSPIKSRLIRYLRIFLLAYRGFIEDRVNLRASALTYYTLMSIVPVLAMGFGIAKGFGMDKYLEGQLMESFEGQEEVFAQLIEFSNSLLQRTGGGIIAGIGVAVLFYSVLMVFSHIEYSFNDIWHIKESRSFTRKFSDYLSMMLVTPILIIASSGINVFISTQVTQLSDRMELINYLGPYLMFLLEFSPYLITWILFTLVYIVMPNTKVNIKSGIFAGIIAGTAFIVTQWIYIDFQVGVSRYNAIYGSFAALPLFLLWLQFSWLLVLFGAEISFSYQNQYLYEFETESESISHWSRKTISILIINRIIKQFIDGEFALTAQQLSKELKIPIRLVRSLVQDLSDCNILSKTYTNDPKTPAFQPATYIDKLTISYVIEKLEQHGSSINIANPQIEKIAEIHRSFLERAAQSPHNIAIKDL
jgi:membrane protein